MRRRPEWMTLRDGLILEFLVENDLELPAKPIYRNLSRRGYKIGYSTVRLRLKELENRGYVEKLDESGYYQVSKRGRRWVSGESLDEDIEDEGLDL